MSTPARTGTGNGARTIVGLSGGVDSSVAALLLRDAGEPVADMVRPEMHFAAASADAQHRIQSPRPATLGANALALEAGE